MLFFQDYCLIRIFHNLHNVTSKNEGGGALSASWLTQHTVITIYYPAHGYSDNFWSLLAFVFISANVCPWTFCRLQILHYGNSVRKSYKAFWGRKGTIWEHKLCLDVRVLCYIIPGSSQGSYHSLWAVMVAFVIV